MKNHPFYGWGSFFLLNLTLFLFSIISWNTLFNFIFIIMKKITLYRTGKHDFLSGKIEKDCARKLFAETKLLQRELGTTCLIISSHQPEAMNTAKIIKLIHGKAWISENPFLSRYYADDVERVKDKLLRQIRTNYSFCNHIIVVSHLETICKLTEQHIRQGDCLVIEAESWKDIFDMSANRISTMKERLSESTEDDWSKSLIDKLDTQDLSRIDAQPFLLD